MLRFLFALSIAIFFLSDYSFAKQAATKDAFQKITFDREFIFNEVLDTISEHFVYQSKLNSETWLENKSQFRKAALAAKTRDEFSANINSLLQTLETSHTRYYSRTSPKHFQLAGVFHRVFPDTIEGQFIYEGIGIDTVVVDGRTLIRSVFEGFPAKDVGLQFGDEIVSANGKPFHAIGSFIGQSGEEVKLSIRRVDKSLSVSLPVVTLDGRTMFETALKASVRVIEQGDQKVGYMHVWSYAGTQYQDIIREQLLWGDLSDCDSLILDLRDGWGGADINYLNLYRPPIAEIESTNVAGEKRNFTGVWNKPVVLLVNERSTSGKELFAYGFRKLQLGKIIGTKTSGSVVAGRCFQLSNGDLLYLAVSDVKIDRQRLEGSGVAPDIDVARPLSHIDSDSQLDAAIEFLSKKTSE